MHRRGNGCVRDNEFRRDVDVAVLSERRRIAPYGIVVVIKRSVARISGFVNRHRAAALLDMGGMFSRVYIPPKVFRLSCG